ncbi:MAG: tRNA (adenosine(37)-N6)-threonylcarbamoyltransferase complex dimerization subunit type 1 TsaB [Desulfatibacillum sp.]|nr:tRNA (adenosine(37)-N6)-threonylcarbamoyltransferase complex dimerization subunit type 1 TsaB [Desulfatibacillum sp.]
MKILAMDTAAMGYGVALVEDGRVLAQFEGTRSKSHGRHLMDAVREVLEQADCGPTDIQGVAVTAGPGSFTGLRIGIASAKGLASALDIPVYGVSTLQALAHSVGPWDMAIQAAIDARKGQVYAARFRLGAKGLNRETPESAMDPEQWIEEITEDSLFVGDGSALYSEIVKSRLGNKAVFAPEFLNRINIITVANIARDAFEQGRAGTAGDLKATYVRKSDAKLPKAPLPV